MSKASRPGTASQPGPAPQPGPAAPTGGPAPSPADVVRDDAALVGVGGPLVEGLGAAALAVGAPVIPVPAGGPGVGADRVAERVEGVDARPLDPRTADPRGPRSSDVRQGVVTAGSTLGAGVGTRTIFDPDDIPGTRTLEALAHIRRDERSYEPGDGIELDFRGYEELVSIGAVPPIDWATGEPLRLGRPRP